VPDTGEEKVPVTLFQETPYGIHYDKGRVSLFRSAFKVYCRRHIDTIAGDFYEI
jgi:hypothetical protein